MSHKLDDQVAVCLLLGNAWLSEPLQPQELGDENVLWRQGWLSLDSSENVRAKRNGSNTQNVWDISSSLRME